MNSEIQYAIQHPDKGCVGLSNGAPTYPNEQNPTEFDPGKTFLGSSRHLVADIVKNSTLLKSNNCKVVSIIVSYKIGEILEDE